LNYKIVKHRVKHPYKQKSQNPQFLDIKNATAELFLEILVAALGCSFGDYERNYLKIQAQPK
jgi:hypothetical protein